MTSVGSTQKFPEISNFFTSGGFSNFFQVPSYQPSAIGPYLSALGSTNAGKFNPIGRGFPDVSAVGFNIQTVFLGDSGPVAGSTTALPMFAATVVLLNDRRIAMGRPRLGFLNPFLYGAAATAFNDVTMGRSNSGCGTSGFPVVAGWDPVRPGDSSIIWLC